jgi:hypothetical protein
VTVNGLAGVETLAGASRHSYRAFPFARRSGPDDHHSERRDDGEADGDEGRAEGRQRHVVRGVNDGEAD